MEAILLVTEWDEFKTADWSEISQLVHSKVLFDGRNILSNHEEIQANWQYKSIGQA